MSLGLLQDFIVSIVALGLYVEYTMFEEHM